MEALPSVVRELPSSFVATPMFPEMKMQEGLSEMLRNEDPPQRLQVTLCRRDVESSQDNLDAVFQILSPLQESERERRMEEFLQTRSTRDPDREVSWRRRLGGIKSSCRDLLEYTDIAIADHSGELLSLTIAPEAKKCLERLVIVLATDPNICFLGVLPAISPLNAIESALVQSGNTESKPFHDVGLDGRNEIVAVSDSGVDVDNCYFLDHDKVAILYSNANVWTMTSFCSRLY